MPPRDFDRAPWNRWSFRNIRACVPTEEIAGSASPLDWETAPRDLSGVAFTGHDGSAMTLADLLAGYTDGFLVAHKGRILHESYHNGMDAATPEPHPNQRPTNPSSPHAFGLRSPNEDAAARAERINRIREQINDGTYDTPEKMEAALDRLFDLLQASR